MSKKIAEHQPMEGITVFEVENKIDHLTYLPDMEQIDPSVRLQVEEAFTAYDPASFTEADVRAALEADTLTPHDFGALLSPQPNRSSRKWHNERAARSAVSSAITSTCSPPSIWRTTARTTHLLRFQLPQQDPSCTARHRTDRGRDGGHRPNGLEEVLILTAKAAPRAPWNTSVKPARSPRDISKTWALRSIL